jgi:lyso-ornithine lipid O-acyltransferase
MWLRGAARSAGVLAWTLLLLPIQILFLTISKIVAFHRWPYMVPGLYHRGAAKIIGLRVTISGDAITDAPVLYVANHLSWLDIIALGSVLDAGFVAKKEVASWPGFGLLARLQGSVFVDRSRQKTKSETIRISAIMASGRSLVLFPEGTSSDGTEILPFRSSFLSVAEQSSKLSILHVQPVSITYVRRAGIPLEDADMPGIAWYADMTLLPHLWQFFCASGRTDVTLSFHPQADLTDLKSRKALAQYCQGAVAEGVARARRDARTTPAS